MSHPQLPSTVEWLNHHERKFTEHITALGVIALRWNEAEVETKHFVGAYIRLSKDAFRPVLRQLGNVTLIDVLIETVAAREKDPMLAEAIHFLAKLFGRCRENRNDLMHSLLAHTPRSMKAKNPEFCLVKPISQRAIRAKNFRFDFGDLQRVADDLESLIVFAIRMNDVIAVIRYPKRLKRISAQKLLQLSRPPLPDKLIPLPPEAW
jgi:hypothetical protein